MDAENPYAAPTTAPENPQLPDAPFITAGKGKRFANLLIDYVVTTALSFAAGIVVGLLLAANSDETTIGLVGNLAGLLVYFAYHTIMEGTMGRTVGKLATGTKVVDADGNRPTMGRAALRTLCRIIPFEPFSFLGKEGRGWHDSLTKTWVIESR